MSVLAFPSRFALLARAWRFDFASRSVAAALGISADRLSKMVSGDTKNLTASASSSELTHKLAEYLERTGVLADRGVDRVTFTEVFGAADDLEFIRFIAAGRSVPLPPSVVAVPRRNAQNLFRSLGGLCLLYRLGVEERKESIRGGRLIKELPVLRRIPVVIEDIDEGYLRYWHSYGWYEEGFKARSATGFVFFIKDHFTILAEDGEPGGFAELFLAQLGQDAIRVDADAGGSLYQGVMVMNGDTSVPTACKVLLRHVSKPMQEQLTYRSNESSREDLARALERKFYLQLNDQDGALEFATDQNPKSAVETTDLEPFSGLQYSWYANRLQIRESILDIHKDP